MKDIFYIISSGADVNLTRRKDKNTALHLAAQAGLIDLS